MGPREWRLFYEALAALPAISFRPLTREETELFLLLQQEQQQKQQQQQQQQASSFPTEQRRLGTAALVSPSGRDDADWAPFWGSGSGSGSSRIQDWGSDYDGNSETSRLLMQVSPVSASAAAAAAAAEEEEAQEAASLMRAWGVGGRQMGGPLGDFYRRQVVAEAHAALECLGETVHAAGEIDAADFAGAPAAVAAVSGSL